LIASIAACSLATPSVETNAASVGANTVYCVVPLRASTSPARTTAACSTSNSPSSASTICTMVWLPGFAAAAAAGRASSDAGAVRRGGRHRRRARVAGHDANTHDAHAQGAEQLLHDFLLC
jgi:hypothetical protein